MISLGIRSTAHLTNKGAIMNATHDAAASNSTATPTSLTLFADMSAASDPADYCPYCDCIDAECLCLPTALDAEKDSLDASSTPPDKPFRFEYAFESITVRGSRFKANRPIG